jgi:hypothetical protein
MYRANATVPSASYCTVALGSSRSGSGSVALVMAESRTHPTFFAVSAGSVYIAAITGQKRASR